MACAVDSRQGLSCGVCENTPNQVWMFVVKGASFRSLCLNLENAKAVTQVTQQPSTLTLALRVEDPTRPTPYLH